MYVLVTLAVGLAMLGSAAAGIAGLDGRLATAAQAERDCPERSRSL